MTPQVKELLRSSSFLQFLKDEQFEQVVKLFHEQRYDFGDLIVKQGEVSDAFFILTSGRARVIKTINAKEEIVLGSLRPGSEFGETALLNEETRTATIRCSTPVEVQRLSRDKFLELVERYPELRRRLETTARWRTLHDFLYQFSSFGKIPSQGLRKLLEKLEPVEFQKGDLVVRQGDPAGPLYIIESGKLRVFATVEGHTRDLRYLRDGDYFGEVSIIDDSPRAASVEAVSDCKLLALSQESTNELRDEFPEFNEIFEERKALYEAKTQARVPLDFSSELLPAEARVPGDEVAESDRALEADKGEASDALFADERGYFKKRGKRIRKIPFIRQIDQMDCGAAALGMVCRHFGQNVSLARIRQLCHTSHDGTSLSALTNAASELGLAARAVKVSPRNLPHMPLPAIVHWGGNHWTVLYRVNKDSVLLADPGRGHRRISTPEFLRQWSGYSALFDYTPDFENAPEGTSALSWLWPFFTQFRWTFVQALLLAVIASSLVLLLPIFTQVITDRVIVRKDPDLLLLIITGMVVAQLFTLGANLLQQYLLSFVTVKIDSAMLDYLTRKLLSLPMSYFSSRRTGDIQRRLDGARQIRTFIVQQAMGGILAGVQLLLCLALMGQYSGWLLFLFLCSVPVYGSLMLFSSKVLRPIYADLEESQSRYGSSQIDAIKGIEAVKAAAAEQTFRDGMLNEFLALAKKRFRGGFIANSYQSVIQVINLFNSVVFIGVGAGMVINEQFTIGGFVAYNTLIAIASVSIMRSVGLWNGFQMFTVLINRLSDVFEQEPEQGHDRSRLMPVPTLEGRIQLRNVSFRYGGPGAPDILSGLDIEVAPGRTVAIVGRSGCGKTTLIKLIAGLLEPTSGAIFYDGVDMKTLNYRDLRKHIGIVLQENHMFSATILQNIAFGDPEPNFEKASRAAQLAAAHEFIMRLPLGYETKIGESGLALSGGQQQRISIARALYNDPPILIFDEATSALDTESERAIQSNLQSVMATRTSIVIAHRLSTVREADSIIVLDQGRKVEQGTHDELVKQGGLYSALSGQQLNI